MSALPSETTPLNQHSLRALELWLQELGATRIDEKLLEEMRKSEALEAAEEEFEQANASNPQTNGRIEQREVSNHQSLDEGQTSIYEYEFTIKDGTEEIE